MKKFTMIIAIALIGALCFGCLVACGNNYSGNPEDDKKMLEDKGYTVYLQDLGEDNDTVAILSATKSNYELKDILDDEDKIKDLKIETISIVYCKDEEIAKTKYDEAKNNMDDAPKGAKISRKGKMVIAEYTLTGEDAMQGNF